MQSLIAFIGNCCRRGRSLIARIGGNYAPQPLDFRGIIWYHRNDHYDMHKTKEVLAMKKYLNPWLFFFGVSYCVLCCVLCGVMIFITDTNNPEYALIVAVWIVLAALMILAGFLCLPRWAAYVKIHDGNVIYKQPFEKKKVGSINAFKYAYKAYYRHFGLKRYFIVISHHPLNKHQLSHINHIKTSAKLIKFKYNRRNLRFARQVLPQKMLSKLGD